MLFGMGQCLFWLMRQEKKNTNCAHGVAWVGLRVWWSVCDGTMGVRVRLCGTNGVAKGWRENWQVCKVRVRVC